MGLLARVAAWLAARTPNKLRGWMYRLGPVSRALRRVLNRAVPTRPTEVEVAAGLLKGTRFELDLQSEKDLWLGTYELELQSLLPELIKPGMTVYDVGANIGYLTVAFAGLVGETGVVVAFEPLPDNVRRLEAALEANGLEERVRVVPAAVGRAQGRSPFLVHASAGMGKLAGSAGREADYRATVEVKVMALDVWKQDERLPAPDWIKVDVEGGEAEVLAGAQNLLNDVRPGWILELHGPDAAARAMRTLRAANYRLHRAEPRFSEVNSATALDWKAYIVAVPAEGNHLEGLA